MATLIFDPFAGVSGDMTVAALIDLGLDEAWLSSFVASLGLGDIGVEVRRVERSGIACPHVTFHTPHEHRHRHLRDILDILNSAPLPDLPKAWAADAFRRIAVAEAKVHGIAVENVHFHEVGALDSILDVLCAMAGVHRLGFDTFHTRPVAVGHGWIDIAHGRFPVPAPATLSILQGHELSGFDLEGECTTPTGAAIVAALTRGSGPPTGLRPKRTGFGAGTRDPADRPNCLRLIECEALPSTDALRLVQTDIDDLAPEYVPPAMDALFEAGALDVVGTPILMKRGRPGLRLEVLVTAAAFDAVIATLFRETPTIGVRYWPVDRSALSRDEEIVVWRGQTIRRKRVRLPGGGERSKPESEDVIRAAKALNLPAWRVRLALEEDEPNKSMGQG